MPPRASRRTVVWVAVLLLAVAVFSLPWILPPLAERGAVVLLHRAGLGDVALEVERVGLTGSRIRDVRLGRAPDLVIHELEVDYSAGGLLRGRLARLLVRGVTLRSTLGPEGLSFGDLDALLVSDEEAPPTETTVPAILPDRIEIDELEVIVVEPDGTYRVSGRLSGELTDSGLGTLQADAALEHDAERGSGSVSIGLGEDGALEIAVHLEAAESGGPVPLDGARLEVFARGRLPLAARILGEPAVAEWIATSELDGKVEGSWSGLALEGLPVHDGELMLDFDVQRGELDAEIARLAFAPAGAAPLVARAKLRATAPDAEHLSLEEATLRWDAWSFDGRRLGPGRFAMSGEGTAEGFEAAVELAASLHGAWLPDVDLADASVSIGAQLRLSSEDLSVRVPDCVRVALGPSSLPSGLRLPERHEFCLRQTRDPGLGLRFGEAGPVGDMAFTVEPTSLTLDLEGAPFVRGTTPALRIASHVDGERWTSTVETEGGVLRLPDAAAEIEGIALRIRGEGEGAALGHAATVRVEKLRHADPSPAVTPFSLDGTASGDADRLDFGVRLRDKTGLISLRAEGQHRLASATGRATIAIDPLVLSEAGPGLGELSPRLRGLVESASGRLVGSGEASWSEKGLDSSFELTVEALSVDSIYATLENAAGVVRLDTLWPPVSAPRQRLTFDRLEAGLPLTEGVVVFQIVPGFRLEVLEAGGRIANGSVGGEGVVDLERDEQSFVLRAQEIDLGALVLLAEVEGLQATGSLQGRLPVALEKGEVVVREGLLSAAPGGGVIRYRGSAADAALGGAGGYGQMVTRALEDFHYRELAIRVNGGVDTELEAVLELRGSSPAVENGRPMEITLSLSGDLGPTLQDYFWSQRLGEVLTEGMRGMLEQRIRRRGTAK